MESLESLTLPSPLKKIVSKYKLQANLHSILLSDFAFLIFKFLSYEDVFKLVNISYEVRNEPKTFLNIINLKNKHYISFFNYYIKIIIKKFNANRVYFMLQFVPDDLDQYFRITYGVLHELPI